MKKLIFVFSIIYIFASGCVYVPKETVLLSQDVALVQTETSDALIKGIDTDLLKYKTGSEEANSLNILKERLDYLKRGNQALAKSMSRQLKSEELAALLVEKNKITGENK